MMVCQVVNMHLLRQPFTAMQYTGQLLLGHQVTFATVSYGPSVAQKSLGFFYEPKTNCVERQTAIDETQVY
jgi:hypothetical protein